MTAAGNAPRTFAGWVGVDGNRIALVTESETAAAEFRAAHPGLREFDCRGKLVMPGLVNTHCHAAMTLQRSLADDIALMEWLHDYIWPFEARQTADDVALGMTLGVVEMLLGGVTSFVDMYYFENRCVETVERLGIRAMLGCNYFDSNVDAVMPQVEEAVRLAAGCDRVQIALAPHSPYTVSPENLLRGKRLADKYGLHLMTHISETQDEVRIVREKYGKTSVEHLDGLGLLGPKTIGAHCIHVTDSDIETLAARGVAVSHNPQSNMKISSGVAPVERMRAAGALVTVGTDGTCSNNDLDMLGGAHGGLPAKIRDGRSRGPSGLGGAAAGDGERRAGDGLCRRRTGRRPRGRAGRPDRRGPSETPFAARQRRGVESGLLRQGLGCRYGGRRRTDRRREPLRGGRRPAGALCRGCGGRRANQSRPMTGCGGARCGVPSRKSGSQPGGIGIALNHLIIKTIELWITR